MIKSLALMLPSWIPHKNPNFGNLEALEQESEISEKDVMYQQDYGAQQNSKP